MIINEFDKITLIEYSGVFDETSKQMLLTYFPKVEIFEKSLKSVNLSALAIEYLMINFKNSKEILKLLYQFSIK